MSIVITGNPGVGKHTITKKISEILSFPIIDINIVAKDLGLFEKNENTNDVDTQKLAKILEKQKLNENIIIGHLAPYVLEKNQVKIIIILRRNPYDLELVYKERNYTEIKINNGFSDSEIINKSRSLKGVMEPFSSNANIQLAKRAGFKDIMSVFKYINFEGFLAIK